MGHSVPAPKTPRFEEIQNLLGHFSAAEAHGMLSAFLCVEPKVALHVWLAELQTFIEADIDDEMLQHLCLSTFAQLTDIDFGFNLFLPESEDIVLKSQALSEWCHGFLYGIGVSRPQLPEDALEFIQDLTEFSRFNFELENVDEEDEIALEEVIEFIRMGVILTSHQLNANLPNAPTVH